MMTLRQSTASQSVVIGPFVDSTDGNTAETGLSIANTDIRLSKNGGNIVGKNSGGGTHDELGYYTITLDATDTNTVGRLQLMVHVAGALPVYHEFIVLEEAVFDAQFAASAPGYVTNAPVNVAQFGGTNGTFSGGRPEVNASHWGGTAVATARPLVDVAQISGDATAADNLEAACDGTGYNVGGGSVVAASVTGAVGSVTGNVGGNVSGSVGSVTGNVGGTVNGLTSTAQGHVQSAAAAALTAYDPPTNAEMEARTLAAASYATASALATVDSNVDAILEDTGTTLPGALSTIAGYLDTEIAAIMAVTDKLDDTLEDAGGGNYVFTEAALANAPAGEGGGGGGATAEEIWEYASRTLTANPGLSAGDVRDAVGLDSANLDTQLAAIVEDTGTTLPAQIGGLNNLSAAEVNAEVDTALAAIGLTTTVTGRIDAAVSTRASQTIAEAIEADTQDIQGRIPDALVGGSIKANITHVIGDAVQENGATDTNWGGTP